MHRTSALAGLLCAVVVPATACRGPTGHAATRPPPKQAAAANANRRCTECHVDFGDEGLTAAHQKAGVTCVRCHGHSQAHIDDEVRATKPDAVFRGTAMKVFCLTCHAPRGYRARPSHRANEAAGPAERRSCTACHGEHELVTIE